MAKSPVPARGKGLVGGMWVIECTSLIECIIGCIEMKGIIQIVGFICLQTVVP